MDNLQLSGGEIATAIEDWGPKLVAVPAGYAIGAWLGTLVAFAAGEDRDARADRRDLSGVIGGLVGFLVWFFIAFAVH